MNFVLFNFWDMNSYVKFNSKQLFFMNTYKKTSFTVAKMRFYVYKGICQKIQWKILSFYFFCIFVLFCSWKIIWKPMGQSVWPRQLFWYPYWNILWQFMACVIKCHKMTFYDISLITVECWVFVSLIITWCIIS